MSVDAALWQPGGKAAAATTLVVSVHGSGGSFAKPPINFLTLLSAANSAGSLVPSTLLMKSISRPRD